MINTTVFASDLIASIGVSSAVAAYLHPHLRALLVELCGTYDRARFWLAFSNVALILMPLIFALEYKPEMAPGSAAIFEIAAQMKYALVGLIVTIGILGLVLISFMARSVPAAPQR